MFTAIFASPLRETFGVRAVVTVSGVLIGGSMIASSFATSLSQVAVILTVFAGKNRKRLSSIRHSHTYIFFTFWVEQRKHYESGT